MKQVVTLKEVRQAHEETKLAYLLQLNTILKQQAKERHYTKQKPYSHTLVEKLYQDLSQYKIE